MPAVIVLGGIFGTELNASLLGVQSKVWVSYLQLGAGNFKTLKLATDGIAPDPTFGNSLIVKGPLPEYYGPCMQALRDQLGPKGWDIIPFGYDWRKDVRGQGLRLSAAVQLLANKNDPCTIVGHSMGGLVARAAWYYLKQLGLTNLVRRIITLGTPHWGSYNIYDLMNGDEETLQTLARASTPAWEVLPHSPMQPGWSAVETVLSILNSWPSPYQLLPTEGIPLDPPDPHRPLIFDPTLWPDTRHITHEFLTDAATTWAAFLQNPDTQPPPDVLTCVAGIGSGSVPTRLVPGKNGLANVYQPGMHQTGDGQVALQSAGLHTAGVLATVQCGHADLPNFTAQSGLLSQLIRMENPTALRVATPVPVDLTAEPPPELFLRDETAPVTVLGDFPAEPIVACPDFPAVLGMPPYPARATLGRAGYVQIIDHDC